MVCSTTMNLNAVKSKYPNLMQDIRTSLYHKQIKCQASQSEIIAINTPETTVTSVISSLIDSSDRKILLDIVGVRGNVYIRKKT